MDRASYMAMIGPLIKACSPIYHEEFRWVDLVDLDIRRTYCGMESCEDSSATMYAKLPRNRIPCTLYSIALASYLSYLLRILYSLTRFVEGN